jgi:hypothetical protein
MAPASVVMYDIPGWPWHDIITSFCHGDPDFDKESEWAAYIDHAWPRILKALREPPAKATFLSLWLDDMDDQRVKLTLSAGQHSTTAMQQMVDPIIEKHKGPGYEDAIKFLRSGGKEGKACEAIDQEELDQELYVLKTAGKRTCNVYFRSQLHARQLLALGARENNIAVSGQYTAKELVYHVEKTRDTWIRAGRPEPKVGKPRRNLIAAWPAFLAEVRVYLGKDVSGDAEDADEPRKAGKTDVPEVLLKVNTCKAERSAYGGGGDCGGRIQLW